MQPETPTPLNIRLTSWEKWGFRIATPFTREGLEHLKGGGFNGIFVGGGSGMGPDAVSPEMFVESTVIPDLMPESRRSNEKLIRERMALTRSLGLDCWLIVWGVPGPDESYGTAYANNSQTVDRRIKLEMRGLLQRQPDLFGQRDPQGCSWRGNRPLCLSQPTVQAYYRELYANLCRDFPELDGLVFFPGDHNPECCDESCPRCGSAPGGPWSVYIRFLNEAVETVLEARPDLPIYVVVWNPEIDVRNWIIRKSHPACGVILPFPDIVDEQRRTGRLETAQPWLSIDRMGWLTTENAGMAREEGRPILALHEFCQSEVYDPCHAFALPGKTINVLHKLAADDFSGIMDFWGDYPPVTRNANMMAVRAYLDDPQATREELLQRVAAKAIGAQPELPQLTNALLDVWGKIEQAVDDQAYFTWFQRLNAGIGRQGARGHLYLPLIPSFLDLDERPRDNYFQKHIRIWIDGRLGSIHGQAQLDDRDTFIELADESEQAGALCQQEGQSAGADFLREQALNLHLYASLIASLGRSVWALEAYSTKDAELLRKLMLEEVDARHEQIRLTDQLGYGINRVLVEEDIQLMLQFLAASDFPNTTPAAFSFSPVPYYD